MEMGVIANKIRAWGMDSGKEKQMVIDGEGWKIHNNVPRTNPIKCDPSKDNKISTKMYSILNHIINGCYILKIWTRHNTIPLLTFTR